MPIYIKPFCTAFFVLLLFLACRSKTQDHKPVQAKENFAWQTVDTGLYLCHFKAPVKSIVNDSKITVLKIDPAQYDFTLISSKEKREPNKTAKAWAKSRKAIAVINAGMYKKDYMTNTSYMRSGNFVNNAERTRDNIVFAFSPKNTALPKAKLADLECESWDSLQNQYSGLVQGIRMVDCKQNNKWQVQDKKWSMAVLGQDKKGNILFIHCRSPYPVHDFIEMLLKLPLDLDRAMYLEGGPEASFYLDHKGVKAEKFGSYETGFIEHDGNDHYWDIPNMIGITKMK